MQTRLVKLSTMLVAGSLWLAAADLEQKIQRVENGLQRAVTIKGQPAPKMIITERMQHYKVPGVSVAVIDGGKLEWARGYGVTSVDGGKPVAADTLFQAASISKHVAAMVALRLVEQGKLSLDEDVNLKLRSWKIPDSDLTKTEKVTLRRLLNHSAGLTVHGFRGYAANEPAPSLLEVLDGKKPANSSPVRVDITPGSRWRYSGGGYEVMQQLVIDVGGKPFPQIARELVLDPLAMSHSTYEQPLPARYVANAAEGHRANGTRIDGRWHTYPEMAAAGLWTTPTDLARVVLELQKGGQALKPPTVSEMLTKVLGDYGLGLSIGDTGGAKSFSHGGSNEGFRCMMFAYRDSGRGAIVMTNGDRGSELASEILRGIAAGYAWPDYKVQEKAPVQVAPEILRSYAGKYRFTPGPEISVVFEDGRLLIKSGAAAPLEIFHESDTSFFSTDGVVVPPLRFAKNEDGSIELKAGGSSAKRQ